MGFSRRASSIKTTLSALNVPADVRLRQLQINLVRLKAFSGNLGERFVMANIPAAAVETVENGVVATHHVAGVGRFERQSPVMMTKATDIDFNPFWTVSGLDHQKRSDSANAGRSALSDRAQDPHFR